MKNKKNRQWNKYYFTITLRSGCNTKPVMLTYILAHSKEQAYMKMIKNLQYRDFFERYNLRSMKIIYVDVIASLHNYLHECVNGVLYDYACHWCNKIGGDCDDDIL